MRTLLCFLLAAAALLSVTGCSDDSGGAESLDDSLARLEQARKDGQWSKPGDPISTTGPIKSDVPTAGSFVVRVESSAGDFTIEVQREWAPIGAERFYQLVKGGFYNECRYFRVVPDFMVQFGINGDPGTQHQWEKNIQDDPVKQSNTKGFVTFATSGPNSRTTQIFVNYGDNSFLDSKGFAPFGQVQTGMSNVEAIYSKHGEKPQQGLITSNGNAYLKKDFPELDYVQKMYLVSETTPPIDAN